jgi:hypothetical protein
MRDVEWTCGIEQVTGSAGGKLAQFGIRYGQKTTIAPGDTLLAKCPISINQITAATVIPIINYKTWFFPRSFSDASFTWLATAQPPQWVEGKPLQ